MVVFGFRIFKKMHVTMKNDSHHEPLNNLPSMSHETSKFEGGHDTSIRIVDSWKSDGPFESMYFPLEMVIFQPVMLVFRGVVSGRVKVA